MKRILLSIIVIIVLLSACQPTPENKIVQSKNDDVMELAISGDEKVYNSDDPEQDESAVLLEAVEEQADMLNTGTWIDNSIEGNPYITISADAEILMPDVSKYIIYEITPLTPIPDEILLNLLQSLVGTHPLYDGNGKSVGELENEIFRLKKRIFDYENDEFKDTFSEDQGVTYEEYKSDNIKSLQMRISKMEEDIAAGIYGANTVVDIKNINFDNISYLKADLGRDELAHIMFYDKYSFSMKNPGHYHIDYRGETQSEFVPEAEKELNISSDYALEMINTLMDDVGIRSYDIRYMGIGEEYGGIQELAYGNLEQGYIIILSRIVNGMPVECASGFNARTLEDGTIAVEYYADEFKFYAENLSFVADDMGITQMDWEYYYDIDYQSARIVEIMPMDDTLKKIIVQQIINCYSFYEEQNTIAHFDIDRVELVMGRVPMKNNPDKQWLVPMWNVYAYYEVNHEGEEPFRTPNSRLILSINALDGSVN